VAQVIEVRFYNGNEKLADEMTQAQNHEEAITLALREWSSGLANLVRIEKQGVGDLILGSSDAWRYRYYCVINAQDDPTEREIVAILFATYRETSEKGQPFDKYKEVNGQLVKM